jgi:hypothetical protein
LKTISEITEEFKKDIEKASKEAIAKAYGEFVNDCSIWAESDVESNVADHAGEDIKKMLAGEDPQFIKEHLIRFDIGNLQKIRDLIWKQCGDEIVKKSLESKDDEIKRLKDRISDLHSSFRF